MRASSQPPGDPGHDPYAALRFSGFRAYLCGNAMATVGMQMLAVTIGWELYETTNSATALGLVGLCQILPILLLVVPAGHLVDRFSRKTILLVDQLLLAFSAALLALASFYQDRIPDLAVLRTANDWLGKLAGFFHETDFHFTSPHVPILFALLLLNGV